MSAERRLHRERVRVEPSVEQLLAPAHTRQPWKTADSLSGSTFERVIVDGQPMVVKYVCVDDDWIMRATGDLHCRQFELYKSSVFDSLPPSIDHAVVACAPYVSARGHRGCALLMHDVGDAMIPAGADVIALATHRSFLRDMASMHAAYWGWQDNIGLLPLSHHYVFLTPLMAELEGNTDAADPVPPAVASGWQALHALHPREATALQRLADDPWPLVTALRSTPQTFIQADWKLGNLGRHSDGRTILIDWDRCGEAPACVELAWYLGVNCDRLPESKEDAISAYRECLEEAGVDTHAWWERQLSVAMVGAFLQLAWSKTGDPVEFSWWSEHFDDGLRHL